MQLPFGSARTKPDPFPDNVRNSKNKAFHITVKVSF
jgi:hypothetical protein